MSGILQGYPFQQRSHAPAPLAYQHLHGTYLDLAQVGISSKSPSHSISEMLKPRVGRVVP